MTSIWSRVSIRESEREGGAPDDADELTSELRGTDVRRGVGVMLAGVFTAQTQKCVPVCDTTEIVRRQATGS
jgi:hypothetical protein